MKQKKKDRYKDELHAKRDWQKKREKNNKKK